MRAIFAIFSLASDGGIHAGRMTAHAGKAGFKTTTKTA